MSGFDRKELSRAQVTATLISFAVRSTNLNVLILSESTFRGQEISSWRSDCVLSLIKTRLSSRGAIPKALTLAQESGLSWQSGTELQALQHG